jgi:hypothetical protein
MKRIALTVLLCASGFSALNLLAQEKTKTEEKTETKREITPLRVQVVISEYDGEKKVSSLPYSLLINAINAETQHPDPSEIRMGLRVPVATSNNSFQYMDVGSNLDGWAAIHEGGRFELHLSVERSSIYRPSGAPKSATSGGIGESEVVGAQPITQTFRTHLDVLLRDGQTIQSTVATDPVSGRVSKIDVTLNVLK